jgi:DNA-binding transcriptional ArsR family regulator
MTPVSQFQPTLWRTCRVLANRKRLQILALLARESRQRVSSVALRLELPLAVASQYLRALEARGLLIVQRVGRRVEYRMAPAKTDARHELVVPLRAALRHDTPAVERLFALATAFTHPRRIEIFRALTTTPQSLGQMQAATRISVRALVRHLAKLQARGFVECRGELYWATIPQDAVGSTLARLAAS